MAAFNDKWLEVFAMACTPGTVSATAFVFAIAIRTESFALTLRCLNTAMPGFVVALFFVAVCLYLFGYRGRILTDDFPDLIEPKAL